MKSRMSFSSILVMAILTLVLSSQGQDKIPVPAQPSSQAGYHIFAHAHNDYDHSRPLLDALENRFYSVEADIWLVDGEILVSHNKGKTKADYKGTLKELYLDPLQKRVDEKGSVFGDGVPFLLWLDIKDGRMELRFELHHLLKSYPMLTAYFGEKTQAGPVLAVLTGDEGIKTPYADEKPIRYACRDGKFIHGATPADNRWLWVAENWRSRFSWKGEGTIPPDQLTQLREIVADIHAQGRKVRFWSTPETPAFWTLALQEGLDLINTDRLSDLNTFLETYHPEDTAGKK